MTDDGRLPCITLWQPWASLLIQPGDELGPFKANETRSWAPPACFVGRRVGIHAAKGSAWRGASRQLRAAVEALWPGAELPLGALLGEATLAGFRQIQGPADARDERDLIAGDWRPGRYAWEFEDRQLYAAPIPIRGGQRIWYVDAWFPLLQHPNRPFRL